jgi:hypothetical protein
LAVGRVAGGKDGFQFAGKLLGVLTCGDALLAG